PRRLPPPPPGGPGPKTRDRRNSSVRVPSSTDEARISFSAVGFHTSTHVTEPSSRFSEKIRANDEPSDFETVRCWAVLTSLDTRSRSAAPIRTESRPTNFPAKPRISVAAGAAAQFWGGFPLFDRL